MSEFTDGLPEERSCSLCGGDPARVCLECYGAAIRAARSRLSEFGRMMVAQIAAWYSNKKPDSTLEEVALIAEGCIPFLIDVVYTLDASGIESMLPEEVVTSTHKLTDNDRAIIRLAADQFAKVANISLSDPQFAVANTELAAVARRWFPFLIKLIERLDGIGDREP